MLYSRVGSIKGYLCEQGAPGPKGDPGYSPTVEVSDIEGGHRITFTTVDGVVSFDVMNGDNRVPEATAADNGKFLRVKDGRWVAQEVPSANGVSI